MRKMTLLIVGLLICLQCQPSFARQQAPQADRRVLIANAYTTILSKQQIVTDILKICANSDPYFASHSSTFLVLWTEKNQKYLSLIVDLRNDLSEIGKKKNMDVLTYLEKLVQTEADKVVNNLPEILDRLDSDGKLQTCAGFAKSITEGKWNIGWNGDSELKNFLDERLLSLQ